MSRINRFSKGDTRRHVRKLKENMNIRVTKNFIGFVIIGTSLVGKRRGIHHWPHEAMHNCMHNFMHDCASMNPKIQFLDSGYFNPAVKSLSEASEVFGSLAKTSVG